MSFNYSLSMSSAQLPAAAFQTISTLPGFEAVAEDVAFGPGVTATVAAADEEDKEYALEHEGFEPTLDVLLVEDHKGVSGEVATKNIVRAVVALLHYADGDAVLRYNNETLLLRLHENDLILNTNSEFWEWYPQLLHLVNLPYRMAALSSK